MHSYAASRLYENFPQIEEEDQPFAASPQALRKTS